MKAARKAFGKWSALPGTDLSVEDPPLEEVMREVFQQGRPAAAAVHHAAVGDWAQAHQAWSAAVSLVAPTGFEPALPP